MTNHTREIRISASTVEAARRAMDELVANQSDVTPTEAVTTILAAAAPHIREQIAHEIDAASLRLTPPDPYRDNYQGGMRHAAAVVRGERP